MNGRNIVHFIQRLPTLNVMRSNFRLETVFIERNRWISSRNVGPKWRHRSPATTRPSGSTWMATQKSSALIEAQEQTKPTAGSRSTRSAAPKFKRNEKIQTKKIARNNEPRNQLRRPPNANHCELLASDANHEKWRHRTTQKVGVTSWPLGGAPIAASGATVPPHKNFEKSNGRLPDDVGMFVLLHLLEQGNFA